MHHAKIETVNYSGCYTNTGKSHALNCLDIVQSKTRNSGKLNCEYRVPEC